MVEELPGIVYYFSFRLVLDVASFLYGPISYFIFGIGYV